MSTLDVLHTDWQGYQLALEAADERPGMRVTYDRGELEIVTVSNPHERRKSSLGCLLECLMLEKGLDFFCGGNQTFQRQDLDRGFEPDLCYWIENWSAVQKMEEFDPMLYPPPDLAIEIEVSHGLLNCLGIYAAMKIPEVWRWTAQEELKVLVLKPEGGYVEQAASPTFPGFDPQDLVPFTQMGNEQPTSRAVRALRDWLRSC